MLSYARMPLQIVSFVNFLRIYMPGENVLSVSSVYCYTHVQYEIFSTCYRNRSNSRDTNIYTAQPWRVSRLTFVNCRRTIVFYLEFTIRFFPTSSPNNTNPLSRQRDNRRRTILIVTEKYRLSTFVVVYPE